MKTKNNQPRLYREHKYIVHLFSELLQQAATLDFSDNNSITSFQTQLHQLASILQAHAAYEESRIHAILKAHESNLYLQAEIQHQDHHTMLQQISDKLALLEHCEDEDLDGLSYDFYLALRTFVSENLIHFDYEERILMPEILRLASAEEIREIDRISYRQMLPEHLSEMMTILFPHMNCADRFIFLSEIKECEPEKFRLAWDTIKVSIEDRELINLVKQLELS